MSSVSEALRQLDGYLDKGHQLTRNIKLIAEEQMPPRRFKGNELAELVGVGLATIYMAEKEGRLPPPDVDPQTGRRLGATLDQALHMQAYFDTRPWRKPGEPPIVMSFTNFKGGCWKTTTSWYAGSYFANLGYRVLFVDLDPQASLTLNNGILPDFETSHEQSLGPFILDEEGFPPSSVAKVVRDTYLGNMKIIPSTLQLAGVEYVLANDIVAARESNEGPGRMLQLFHRVRDSINQVKGDFDIVIVDGTPSLGLLPLNIIFASDVVIVPVPTEITDFASTLSFGDLYRDQVESLMGVFGDQLAVPQMLFLPTRFSPSEKTATSGSEFVLRQIQETFGTACIQSVIKKHEAVVSNLSLMRRTVFDVNAADGSVNREARKRAIANFSSVFDEILQRTVYPHWPSKKALLELRGIY